MIFLKKSFICLYLVAEQSRSIGFIGHTSTLLSTSMGHPYNHFYL